MTTTQTATITSDGMIGDDIVARLNRAYRLLCLSHYAPYLIGPSGSGKSFFGDALGRAYAKRKKCNYWYLQLSSDMTKTTIIAGNRLVANAAGVVEYKAVPGLIGRAAAAGDVVFVDEATHSSSEILLLFNSLIERNGKTSVGDLMIEAHPNFRLIFASNPDTHAGNIRLPQSFAQRLMTFRFDYPSWESEWKIAQNIAISDFNEGVSTGSVNFQYTVPEAVVRWATSYIREVRSDEYPLSARNVSQFALRCAVERWSLERDLGKVYDPNHVDPYFTKGQNRDSVNETAFKRIFGEKKAGGTQDLLRPEMTDFRGFVSFLGIETVRELMLESVGYYLPIDGIDLMRKQLYTKLRESVL